MSNVIAFTRARPAAKAEAAQTEIIEEETDIDPLTAIDAAIRDLADISLNWGTEEARQQAEDCRRMLCRAYRQALGEQACTGLGPYFSEF